MCDQTEVSYLPNQIVWVKLSTLWWPGEVQDQEKLDDEVTSGLKKKPIAVVKFFDEDSYEFPKNLNQIYRYNCLKKDEFIQRGLDICRRGSNRDIPSNMHKFSKDVQRAEELTGGDPNIINDPKFLPEEKPDYREHFGLKPLKKSSTPKKSEFLRRSLPIMRSSNTLGSGLGRSSLSPILSRSSELRVGALFNLKSLSSGIRKYDDKNSTNITPKGLIKMIRLQKKSSEKKSSTEGFMKCYLCSFSCERIDVIIRHCKSHYKGELLPHPPHVPTQYQREFNENVSKCKDRQAYYCNINPRVKQEKSSTKRKMLDDSAPVKKKKSDPNKKEKLSYSNSSDRSPSNMPNDQIKKRRKLKGSKENHISSSEAFREDILKDWDVDDEDEDKFVDDCKKETEEKKEEILAQGVESPDSSGIDILDKKEIPAVTPEKSCFDFDEESEESLMDATLKFGQKLPRVINEDKRGSKSSLSVDDRREDLLMEVDRVLEETEVPELPAVPDLVSDQKKIESNKKNLIIEGVHEIDGQEHPTEPHIQKATDTIEEDNSSFQEACEINIEGQKCGKESLTLTTCELTAKDFLEDCEKNFQISSNTSYEDMSGDSEKTHWHQSQIKEASEDQMKHGADVIALNSKNSDFLIEHSCASDKEGDLVGSNEDNIENILHKRNYDEVTKINSVEIAIVKNDSCEGSSGNLLAVHETLKERQDSHSEIGSAVREGFHQIIEGCENSGSASIESEVSNKKKEGEVQLDVINKLEEEKNIDLSINDGEDSQLKSYTRENYEVIKPEFEDGNCAKKDELGKSIEISTTNFLEEIPRKEIDHEEDVEHIKEEKIKNLNAFAEGNVVHSENIVQQEENDGNKKICKCSDGESLNPEDYKEQICFEKKSNLKIFQGSGVEIHIGEVHNEMECEISDQDMKSNSLQQEEDVEQTILEIKNDTEKTLSEKTGREMSFEVQSGLFTRDNSAVECESKIDCEISEEIFKDKSLQQEEGVGQADFDDNNVAEETLVLEVLERDVKFEMKNELTTSINIAREDESKIKCEISDEDMNNTSLQLEKGAGQSALEINNVKGGILVSEEAEKEVNFEIKNGLITSINIASEDENIMECDISNEVINNNSLELEEGAKQTVLEINNDKKVLLSEEHEREVNSIKNELKRRVNSENLTSAEMEREAEIGINTVVDNMDYSLVDEGERKLDSSIENNDGSEVKLEKKERRQISCALNTIIDNKEKYIEKTGRIEYQLHEPVRERVFELEQGNVGDNDAVMKVHINQPFVGEKCEINKVITKMDDKEENVDIDAKGDNGENKCSEVQEKFVSAYKEEGPFVDRAFSMSVVDLETAPDELGNNNSFTKETDDERTHVNLIDSDDDKSDSDSISDIDESFMKECKPLRADSIQKCAKLNPASNAGRTKRFTRKRYDFVMLYPKKQESEETTPQMLGEKIELDKSNEQDVIPSIQNQNLDIKNMPIVYGGEENTISDNSLAIKNIRDHYGPPPEGVTVVDFKYLNQFDPEDLSPDKVIFTMPSKDEFSELDRRRAAVAATFSTSKTVSKSQPSTAPLPASTVTLPSSLTLNQTNILISKDVATKLSSVTGNVGPRSNRKVYLISQQVGSSNKFIIPTQSSAAGTSLSSGKIVSGTKFSTVPKLIPGTRLITARPMSQASKITGSNKVITNRLNLSASTKVIRAAQPVGPQQSIQKSKILSTSRNRNVMIAEMRSSPEITHLRNIDVQPSTSGSLNRADIKTVVAQPRQVLIQRKEGKKPFFKKQSQPNILHKNPKSIYRPPSISNSLGGGSTGTARTTELPQAEVVLQDIKRESETVEILLRVDAKGNSDNQNVLISDTNASELYILDSSNYESIHQSIEAKPSQDILARALADTQVFPTESNEVEGSVVVEEQYSNPPTLSHNVLETSLTLNQPIMTPLEVPSVTQQAVFRHSRKKNELQPSMPLLTDEIDLHGSSIFINPTGLSTSTPQVSFQIINDSNIVVASGSNAATASTADQRIAFSSDILTNQGRKNSGEYEYINIENQPESKEENVLPEFLKGNFGKRSRFETKKKKRKEHM